jgi:DNA-binding NtrC family response regulator
MRTRNKQNDPLFDRPYASADVLPPAPNTVTSNLAHLLIVDDDANTLASLVRAFRLAVHEATVCDDAGRALELINSQPFDMMLSDVVMPGKDGLSLLGDLRNLGVSVPVMDFGL